MMKNELTILLDLDGVLVDWVGGACRVLGVDRDELEANWGDSWSIADALGVTDEELWAQIDAAGSEFWSELEPYPWADDLVALCESVGDTYILSSPSRNPNSAFGKVEWMTEHLGKGEHFRRFLLGPRKELCARFGSVLIDDRDSNCETFRDHGGAAIVFPRAWNSKRELARWPVKDVQAELTLVKMGFDLYSGGAIR